jgi:8-oxo-dGTP diphosphatase
MPTSVQNAKTIAALGKVTDVAVAVLVRPNGEFLLAQRPAGKPYAGYWEFPGGKVEPGEAVSQALVREIKEELGVDVESAHPWITQVFTYPHATVRLHFFKVVQWRGDPHPHEGQEFSWQSVDQVAVAPLLPANGPVLKALGLPLICGITNATELGVESFQERLGLALERGLRLIQVREKQMQAAALESFARDVVVKAHAYGARVVINSDFALAGKLQADGVHLTSAQLMDLQARPDTGLCGASCHNEQELARAAAFGLDYVFVGPVLATKSHPDVEPLGWTRFAELIAGLPMPVYGIGGLEAGDLEAAQTCGAHGIAMLRAVW